MIDLSVFSDLYNLGFNPIPIIWNVKDKIATAHPEHVTDTEGGKPSIDDVKRWLLNGMKESNGVALKLFPPFGMFDFDIKNSKNKNVYQEWLIKVNANNPELLRKVCIETTRSNGFHVYIKYQKLERKIALAKTDGQEVISVYTGGLLSYCAPSPGYSLIHNDFNDIQELTEDEFDLMVACASEFNEDKEFTPGTSTLEPVDYPVEYENRLIQFDEKCTDQMFVTILNDINLFEVKDDKYKKKRWRPFLRKGSVASYSGKAYFWHKRLLLFTSSLPGFPNWHDSSGMGDSRWSLTPSLILFYKHKRSWPDVNAEIQMWIDNETLEITEKGDVTEQHKVPEDRMKFPYDIFQESIQNFIFSQVIQHEYLAGSIIASIATCIGNSADLEAMDGYIIKPIVYMAIVAPPGASKSPAMKKAFAPVESYDAKLYESYAAKLNEYKQTLATYEKDKKQEKPEPPEYPQLLVKDATIEMVIKVLSHNPMGCCILADELSGFLKRMNQYKQGDEVQKWLEMWNGTSPIVLQRITRAESRVQEPCCSIIGGIQPGVLETLSKGENADNGFYHRFLFVYPQPKQKADWEQIEIPFSVKRDFNNMFSELLSAREGFKVLYKLSTDANTQYKLWFNKYNARYNRAIDDNSKGIIAKYQDYCLRFALIIQVMYDGKYRLGIINKESMERAIRLMNYFFGNMAKAIKTLAPESPVDKLNDNQEKFYKALPQTFSTKTAIGEGEKLKVKDTIVKVWLGRWVEKKLLTVLERGKYDKIY